ncbi:MAG: amino acid permease [Thermoleophilia bacterium]|nr:amino acid permease [Thermoleophilia bacterium]
MDGDGEFSLSRSVSRPMLTLFVIGDILGAGIYALVGEVTGRVGGAVWLSFLVALGLAVFTTFAYAELVTKYPRAAGAALYVNRAFGRPFLTFMVAFAVICSGLASAAALARAFGGDYFTTFVSLPTVVIGLAFITVIGLINFRGIRESTRFNLVFTLVEIAGLILVVIIGAAVLGEGGGDPGRAIEFKQGSPALLAVFSGAGLAFFALIGFEDSVNLAEEARNPRADFPRALFGGVFVAGLIYVVVTVVASMVVPTQDLAGSEGPLLEVTSRGPLAVPDRLFSVIALFALANGALINTIMASRLLYGMAREGIVPEVFGRVHPGRRTPWVAIVFTTAMVGVLLITGGLSDLADTTVVLLLGVFAVVNVSVLVLRREKIAADHFRAPTVMPVIGFFVSLGLLTTKDAETFARAGLLLLIGALMWFVARIDQGRRARTDERVDRGR